MGNTIQPHSELIASFKRTTNSPIESDYIFDSYDLLESWVSSNRQVLHDGLIKVVKGDDDIVFYSIYVKNDTEYSIKRIISSNDINNILESINNGSSDVNDFKDEINKKFSDIDNEIQAIWGVPDESVLPENMNSVAKIISAISSLIKFINELEIKNTDKAISGSTDNDVIKYLSGLKYNSITIINNVLDKFFNKDDSSANTINTWFELQKFLSGFKDTDVLVDFINDRIGDMISFENSDTINIEKIELKSGTVVEGHLRLDPDNGNIIIKRKDGIYSNVELKHENNSINFYVNGNLKTSINMSDLAMKVKDVYYDQATETVVMIITTVNGDSIVRIPMSIVVREWEVSNDDTSAVVLDLDSSVGQGKDKLSARLKISTAEGNSATVLNDGLYVKIPNSNEIKHSDSNVGHVLDILSEKCEHNATEFESLKEQITNLNDSIKLLNDEISNLKKQISDLNEKIDEKHEWINVH